MATVLLEANLRAIYDEPEFIIHNIWRLYGGWYDGNPSRLKPAPDAAGGRRSRICGAVGGRSSELVRNAG